MPMTIESCGDRTMLIMSIDTVESQITPFLNLIGRKYEIRSSSECDESSAHSFDDLGNAI